MVYFGSSPNSDKFMAPVSVLPKPAQATVPVLMVVVVLTPLNLRVQA
jgi:hypothetical protein